MTGGERDPENLVMLRKLVGEVDDLFTGESITVDGVEFVSGYVAGSTADRFYIVKPMKLIDRVRELCAEHVGDNIFELGIAEGGSTALMALWAKPKRLVAIDNEPVRLQALDDFIEARDLSGSVAAHYGVDQADGERLREIVAAEFGGDELDLVIDDASHEYDRTLASFEILFPYVREGGTYLIEDWDNDVAFTAGVAKAMRERAAELQADPSLRAAEAPAAPKGGAPMKRGVPVVRMGMQFLLACAALGEAISEVAANGSYIAVKKGPQKLDPSTFTLDSISPDAFKLISPLKA